MAPIHLPASAATRVLDLRTVNTLLNLCNTTTTNTTHRTTTQCGSGDHGFWRTTTSQPLPTQRKFTGAIILALVMVAIFGLAMLAAAVQALVKEVRQLRASRASRRAARQQARDTRERERLQAVADDWHHGRVASQEQPVPWIKRSISRVVSWSSTSSGSSSRPTDTPLEPVSALTLIMPPPPAYFRGAYHDDDDELPTYYVPGTAIPRSPLPAYEAPSFPMDYFNDDLDSPIEDGDEVWEIQAHRVPFYQSDIIHEFEQVLNQNNGNGGEEQSGSDSIWEDYDGDDSNDGEEPGVEPPHPNQRTASPSWFEGLHSRPQPRFPPERSFSFHVERDAGEGPSSG